MPDIGSITFPAQMTTTPSQLRGAIIRVGPNTIILPAGVGDSELSELRSSRETVERLSVTAADLPRLRGQLPEGLILLNVRGDTSDHTCNAGNANKQGRRQMDELISLN